MDDEILTTGIYTFISNTSKEELYKFLKEV